MLHASIDESEFENKHFTLAALVVAGENLDSLGRELSDLLLKYSVSTPFVPAHAELHGYDMMQQKCDWEGVPLRVVATSVYLKALEIINNHASAFYAETIDKVAQAEKYVNAWNPRTVGIGYILERVNEYASRHNEQVTCYLDDHYTAPEGRKEFVEYKANGTFGYRSSRLANITELEFYDSKDYRGLQAADLCCYTYHRKLNVTSGPPKMLKTQQKMWLAMADIAASGRQRIWP